METALITTIVVLVVTILVMAVVISVCGLKCLLQWPIKREPLGKDGHFTPCAAYGMISQTTTTDLTTPEVAASTTTTGQEEPEYELIPGVKHS